MKRIKFTRDALYENEGYQKGTTYSEGSTHDFEDHFADRWLRRGAAVEVNTREPLPADPPASKTEPADPAPKTDAPASSAPAPVSDAKQQPVPLTTEDLPQRSALAPDSARATSQAAKSTAPATATKAAKKAKAASKRKARK